MTELLQFAAVALLAAIWGSVRRVSTAMARNTAVLGEYLQQLEARVEGIEERIRDNFQTDEERQREIDMDA